MTIFSIRYVIWVVQSLNMNALYISIPFLLVSIYLALLLMVTFVNNWSRRHIIFSKVKKYEEPNVWTIIPTYGESIEILEKTIMSWINQDYPIIHRRLVISSQTPGIEVKALVARLNEYAVKKQFEEIAQRRDELRKLRTHTSNLVGALSGQYTALLQYVRLFDGDGLETDESVNARTKLTDQFVRTMEELSILLNYDFGQVFDVDGNLIAGGIDFQEVGFAVQNYCNSVKQLFVDRARSLVTSDNRWHSVIYYNQPSSDTNSKALNLNSALKFVYTIDPNVVYIETRDADDLAPEDFIGYAIGTLINNPEASFVQAKKLTISSGPHPLEPDEPVFFEKIMPAKNASKAVFPCGSGLVWKSSDLAKIGEFPNWNLVEDLYSGFLAWQNGLYGLYIDTVGAIGQVVPEDIPNIYKQRGTWALDTMRLFFWHSKKGLSFWQRLQFAEIGLFYLLSFPVLFLVMVPILSLLVDIHPLVTDHLQYALHFWPFAATVELFLVAMADGYSVRTDLEITTDLVWTGPGIC